MRIAVCFSGQLRTAAMTIENIKGFLGGCLRVSDFFVHTWEWDTSRDDPLCTPHWVTTETKTAFYAAYLPKSMLVEQEHSDRFFHPQFESIYRVVSLKSAYERKHRFKYDLVLRLRPDLLFDPSASLSGVLEQTPITNQVVQAPIDWPVGGFHGLDYTQLHFEDVCWLASSEVMDVVAQFGHVRQCGNPIDWQHHQKRWLVDVNRIPVQDMPCKVKVFRPEHVAEGLTPADYANLCASRVVDIEFAKKTFGT